LTDAGRQPTAPDGTADRHISPIPDPPGAFFCLPAQVANDHGFLQSGRIVPPPREPKIQVMSA